MYIGILGLLVIGWYAGQVITAHITRCEITKRHADEEQVHIPPADLRTPKPLLKQDMREPLVLEASDELDDLEFDVESSMIQIFLKII